MAKQRIFQFPVQGLVVSPDGSHAAVASFDSRLRIVALPSLEVSDSRAGHKDVLYTVDWSPDGRFLATGSNDHTVLLWEAAGGIPHPLWQGDGPIYAVAFAPDGQRLAVAEQGQPIRILAAPSGQEVATLDGHTADVVALTFTPDGRLVSGSRDATARIWPKQEE